MKTQFVHPFSCWWVFFVASHSWLLPTFPFIIVNILEHTQYKHVCHVFSSHISWSNWWVSFRLLLSFPGFLQKCSPTWLQTSILPIGKGQKSFHSVFLPALNFSIPTLSFQCWFNLIHLFCYSYRISWYPLTNLLGFLFNDFPIHVWCLVYSLPCHFLIDCKILWEPTVLKAVMLLISLCGSFSLTLKSLV